MKLLYLIRLMSDKPAAICAGNLGLICTTEPPIAGPRINPKLYLDLLISRIYDVGVCCT